VLRTVNQTKLILVINYLDGGTSLTGTAGQVRDEFRLSYRYVAIVFIMAIYETVINNVTWFLVVCCTVDEDCVVTMKYT